MKRTGLALAALFTSRGYLTEALSWMLMVTFWAYRSRVLDTRW